MTPKIVSSRTKILAFFSLVAFATLFIPRVNHSQAQAQSSSNDQELASNEGPTRSPRLKKHVGTRNPRASQGKLLEGAANQYF